MICAQCQHPNTDAARFCAQCGKPLGAAASSSPPPEPGGMPQAASMQAPRPAASRTVPVVLGIVLVLVVAGAMVVLVHLAAGKLRALAGGTTTSEQAQDAPRDASGTSAAQGATQTGNVIGNLLGTDAKGKSDIGNALNNVVQAGGRIEQHDRASGNTGGAPAAADTQQAMGAAGGLLGALAGSLGGAHRHDPVDFHTLEAMLPTALPGMQRGTPRGSAGNAMGMHTTAAEVDFQGADNARLNVAIKDATAVSGLAGLAATADSNESEQGDSYEKNETVAGQSVHETWDAQSRHGVLSLIVGKRYGVDIEGDNVDMAVLKSALDQIDVGRLEAMKDANPQAQ